MRSPPNVNPAVRRFAALWTLSTLVKVAALAVLLLVVLKLFGGL
ncbi:MAG TPA: hypothetical protein VEG42_06045 [Thermoplasmata archaeon]|jgi:hypothetical protein|nr:hypothetical protein [Thermoplasmata archaeon]HYB78832.1 hypothetical protein [Thermoplasmata archaeon]